MNKLKKIKEFELNNNAAILGYDPELKIQLKLQGTVEVNYDNDVTKSAWDASTSRSKKCSHPLFI